MARSQTETLTATTGGIEYLGVTPIATEPEADTEEEGSRQGMHSDVRLLNSILRQLLKAAPAARRRVMGFLVDLVNEESQS